MRKRSIINLILILVSFSVLVVIAYKKTYHIIATKKEIDAYINKTSIESSNKEINSKYLAILEIPDISLRTGLMPMDSPYNSVKYHVEIIYPSDLPNVINGNLILASHNGTSNVSYFKDLEELTINSQVFIYYEGSKYIYNIDTFYTVNKTGEITITRDKTKTTITLITCKNNSDTEQIVYIGYLTKVASY